MTDYDICVGVRDAAEALNALLLEAGRAGMVSRVWVHPRSGQGVRDCEGVTVDLMRHVVASREI